MHRKISNYLKKWHQKKKRKPLILSGARQVGKTYSVVEFGKNNYQNLIHLNLDNVLERDLFAKVKSVDEFLEAVSIFSKIEILPRQTLIFIDEIQNLPNLVHLLRFFYEEKPEYDFIVAGSLFGNYLAKEKISMPVGRTEYAYMYPLDFFEFLEAVGEKQLLKTLSEVQPGDALSPAIHQLAMKHFYTYLAIGGFPEVVSKYKAGESLLELEKVFNSLFESYIDDVDQYATQAQREYIRHVLKQAPHYAGQLYKYTSFGGGTYSSVKVSHAFRQLEASMLVKEIPATNVKRLPLIAQRKRNKKMIFVDVGLANFKSFGEIINFNQQEASDIFRGRVIEQFVGQNLLSLYSHKKLPLLYWSRKKDRAQAELDFNFAYRGQFCGIEVKSGSTGKLKSLYSFSKNTQSQALLRVYTGELKLEKIVYHGQSYQFHSLPAYLAPRILEFFIL